MSEQLANFLVDLVSDPARMAQVATDPAAQLAHADLSETDRAAMLSRNPHKVAAALGVDYLANGIANDGKGRGRRRRPGARKRRGGKGRKRAPQGRRKTPSKRPKR